MSFRQKRDRSQIAVESQALPRNTSSTKGRTLLYSFAAQRSGGSGRKSSLFIGATRPKGLEKRSLSIACRRRQLGCAVRAEKRNQEEFDEIGENLGQPLCFAG
jgi:hypothetical protein